MPHRRGGRKRHARHGEERSDEAIQKDWAYARMVRLDCFAFGSQ
jgi:hypothetical protein